jgi:hypothetical protein
MQLFVQAVQGLGTMKVLQEQQITNGAIGKTFLWLANKYSYNSGLSAINPLNKFCLPML